MSHVNTIQDGEIWTVLAETRREGIGLPRDTRILVSVGEKRRKKILTLKALRGDWINDPELEEIPVEDRRPGWRWPEDEHRILGDCDPEWHWVGDKALKLPADIPKQRASEQHTVKVGFVKNDPGILVIDVNHNGSAHSTR